MAKKFINPNWQALRKLDARLRDLYFYLWDKADEAGVYELDADYLQTDLKPEQPYTEVDFLQLPCCKKLAVEKYIFTDYIEINFVALKQNYNPHKPLIRALEKHNLKISRSLNQACLKLEDEDTNEDEEEDEKEKGGTGEKTETGAFGGPQLQVAINNHQTLDVDLLLQKVLLDNGFKIQFVQQGIKPELLEPWLMAYNRFLRFQAQTHDTEKRYRHGFAGWLAKRNPLQSNPQDYSPVKNFTDATDSKPPSPSHKSSNGAEQLAAELLQRAKY